MQPRRFRIAIGCLLADEKGIKECLSLKWASGSKTCCFCRNVVGGAEFFDDHDYFVHVASTDVAKFDLHTQSSFDELCTLLVSEVSEGSSKARVADVERSFGIKYDKHAVAFCPAASKVAPSRATALARQNADRLCNSKGGRTPTSGERKDKLSKRSRLLSARLSPWIYVWI